MKPYILMTGLLMILLAGSCSKEYSIIPDPPLNGEVSFNITLSKDNESVFRRVYISANDVENIFVLVFDYNGNFISRTQASQGEEVGNYKVNLPSTDQLLPADKRKRVVHFICNYDWSGFSDITNVGKHENEIIAPLSTSGQEVAYWQRIELSNGISESTFPKTIELIRNVAKISMNNDSNSGSGGNSLSEATFAIGAYMDHGTIAPFNTSTLCFEEGAAVESPFASVQYTQTSDFTMMGVGTNWGNPIYCYERKNSLSREPLYIIVKGKYNSDQTFTYYKIDIIKNGESALCDILRNHHYKIKIKGITGRGASTLLEAINSPASNNLIFSIVLEDYTSVSDGIAILNVETTVKIMVEANKEYKIGFSYFPIAGAAENNSSVQVDLEQSDIPSEQVVSPGSIQVVRTAGKAHILLRTNTTLHPYYINSARLILTTVREGVVLRRVIKLRLRIPITFENLKISPNPAPAAIGSDIEISFKIPNSIQNQLYPFPVYITSKNITPNLDNGKDDKLTLDYQKPGYFRYTYMVTRPGEHTIHFKTSTNAFSENLKLESELFKTEEIAISAS